MAETPVPWEAGDIVNSFHTSLTGTAGSESEISDGEALAFPPSRERQPPSPWSYFGLMQLDTFESELTVRPNVALDSLTSFLCFLFCSSALVYPLRRVVHKLQCIRITRTACFKTQRAGPSPPTT